MSDNTPIDLNQSETEQLSHKELAAKLPKYVGMGGFDPENAEVGENWFFAPSLNQSLTVENMEGYLTGKKTLAELFGLTAIDLYSLAEVGCGYFREAKYHDAKEVFEMLVALNPRHAWFRNLFGTAFLRLDMPDQAAMQYQKAIEYAAKLVEPWVNVAELAILQRDWNAAMIAAQHALEIAEPGKSEEAVARARALVSALSDAKRKSESQADHHA